MTALNNNRRFLRYFAAALVVSATMAGAIDLLSSGRFTWHLKQPAFVQGGIELLALWVLLVAFQCMRAKRLGAALAVTVTVLYLRLHAIDLAAVASGAYCFGIYSLGRRIDTYLSRRQLQDSPIAYSGRRLARATALGISAMTLVLWLPALVWGLSFEKTRLLGMLVAAIGWIFWLLHRPWRTWTLPQWRTDVLSASARALIVVCMLAVLARSNTAIYYDSIWYGLRPDRVLFGEHGVYNFLGLTTQVHYYPKLYEVLLAPLYGWGDLSFVVAFSMWALLLLAIAIQSLARDHGISSRKSWIIATVLVCYPAFAGTAETSKGDVMGAAFVLFGIAALVHTTKTRMSYLLGDVLMYALLATTLRLSTLPWLVVLCVGSALVLANFVRTQPARSLDWLWKGSGVAIGLAFSAALLVHYRTWLLTGTPLITNEDMQSLFDKLGFAIRYPIGHLTGRTTVAGFDGLKWFPQLALHPSGFVFHIIKWLGALWLSAFVLGLFRAAFLRGRKRWLMQNWMLIAMGLAFPALLALGSWPEPGGDGNYFLVPVACICIAGFSVVSTSRLFDAALLACGAIGLAAYLATANWVSGTAPFSIDLSRSPFDEKQQIHGYLARDDLTYLAAYLGSCNRHTRVVGILPNRGPAFALPVRYEPLQESRWNNRSAFVSSSTLADFMQATGTQLLILPDSAAAPWIADHYALYEFVDQAIQDMARRGDATEITRRGVYRIYRLRRSAPLRGCALR